MTALPFLRAGRKVQVSLKPSGPLPTQRLSVIQFCLPILLSLDLILIISRCEQYQPQKLTITPNSQWNDLLISIKTPNSQEKHI